MAVLNFPCADGAAEHPFNSEQVASFASEIASHLGSIERLADMLSTTSDANDRGALCHGIESIARRAAGMADLLNKAHGGVPVRGDFNAWSMPAHLALHTAD